VKSLYSFYITPTDYAEAERNGIGKRTLESRIRDWGWDKHKAITKPPRKIDKYSHWLKIAEENGICESTFYSRVCCLGWNSEKAATTPVMKQVEVNAMRWGDQRVVPEDLIERAATNGISKDTLYHRLFRSHWDPERAATTPINVKKRAKGKKHETRS
jgi:hypothetical protein